MTFKQVLDFFRTHGDVQRLQAREERVIVMQSAEAFQVGVNLSEQVRNVDLIDFVLPLELKFIFEGDHILEEFSKLLSGWFFHSKRQGQVIAKFTIVHLAIHIFGKLGVPGLDQTQVVGVPHLGAGSLPEKSSTDVSVTKERVEVLA